jgi:hypothetical protein
MLRESIPTSHLAELARSVDQYSHGN